MLYIDKELFTLSNDDSSQLASEPVLQLPQKSKKLSVRMANMTQKMEIPVYPKIPRSSNHTETEEKQELKPLMTF